MSIETDSPCEALRRLDARLGEHFAGVALDKRFDERVLARVREADALQIAARRAEAQQQYARCMETLAGQWRSARHVMIATLAAFVTLAIVAGVALRGALPQGLANLADGHVGAGTLPLPSWALMIVAVATVVLGWGISARVKL
jgi:TRAP-type uncharacterized transport system fused permease subunit